MKDLYLIQTIQVLYKGRLDEIPDMIIMDLVYVIQIYLH